MFITCVEACRSIASHNFKLKPRALNYRFRVSYFHTVEDSGPISICYFSKNSMTVEEGQVVESIGPWYWRYKASKNKQVAVDDDTTDAREIVENGTQDTNTAAAIIIDNESKNTLELEDDTDYLINLDPKHWRSQDHYRVLGLGNLRYRATSDDIKQAYRLRVLKHHPDKRERNSVFKNGVIGDISDDYFTCIQMAWEVLSKDSTRRAFDSVDPSFDDSIPSPTTINKNDFYNICGEVFQRNARWSDTNPVPLLGDDNSTREDVEQFYEFWFGFQSWRNFSYEKKEQDEYSDLCREERRWMDKQKKSTWAKHKKEEMSRIRSFVDLAYNNDPRVAKFKAEDKEKKLAAKRAKEEEKILAQKEQKEKEELTRKLKEEEETKKQEEKEKVKNLQLEIKKSHKKLRKNFRNLCAANNYYIENEIELDTHMQFINHVCLSSTVDGLKKCFEELSSRGREYLIEKINEMKERFKEEREEDLKSSVKKNELRINGYNENNSNSKEWSNVEIQLLTKAVNMYPAGTERRWETVANFLSKHENLPLRTAQDVLSKAKEIQNLELKADEIHEVKTLGSSVACEINEFSEEGFSHSWTNLEQKLLEQALKTYPVTTPDRWSRIAECIPCRTKDEVIQRYKELAKAIKAKRS